MKLRLTRPAAHQLDRVLAYVAHHNPQGARNVQDRIRAVMQMHLLLQHPFAGHATPRGSVRRVIARPNPTRSPTA